MALFFAPAANLVMSSVRPSEQGIASGANNALREVGGALGIAVLAIDLRGPGRLRDRARPSSTASGPPWSSARRVVALRGRRGPADTRPPVRPAPARTPRGRPRSWRRPSPTERRRTARTRAYGPDVHRRGRTHAWYACLVRCRLGCQWGLVVLARAGTPRRPPRPADHLPARRPRRPADHRDDRRRGDRRRPRGRRLRHAAAGHRRRLEPGHRRQGLRGDGPAHRHHRLRPRRDGAGAGRRRGVDRRRRPHRRGRARRHRVPRRHPRLRGRHPDPERRARTARRCPRTITEVSPTTAERARRSPSPPPTAPSPTATAASRPTPSATSSCASASSWRTRAGCRRRSSTPRRPAPSASSPATGCRWPPPARPCCKLRAGKGMVLDPEDHDTWSAGLLLHQPDPRRTPSSPRSTRAWRSGSAPTPRRPPTRRGRAAPRPPRPG